MKKKILIPIYTGLGDCVFILPVIESLKVIYPNCEIDVVGDNKSGGNELFIFDGRVSNVYNSLPNKKYDILLNFIFGGISLKKLLIFKLKNLSTKIIAHRFIKNDIADKIIFKILFKFTLFFSLVEYNITKHVIYNNLSLLKYLNINENDWEFDPLMDDDLKIKAQEQFVKYNLKSKRYIVIQVGAAMNALTPKKWPIEYWIELIGYLKDEQIILVGSKNEIEYTNQIKAQNVINLCGKSDIISLIGILSEAKCFIGVDSGIDKLVSLLDTPAICLWGPFNLRFYLDTPNKYLVSKYKKCSPCTGLDLLTEKDAFYACKFKLSCMNDIKPIDVYNIYQQNISIRQ